MVQSLRTGVLSFEKTSKIGDKPTSARADIKVEGIEKRAENPTDVQQTARLAMTVKSIFKYCIYL